MKAACLAGLIVLNLFCARQAAAGDGATFLLIEPSARPSALGGAFAAAKGDLACLLYNPAGLEGLRGLEAAVSHLDSLSDWQHDWVSVGMPLAGSTLAVDFLWSRIRPFALFDSNGDQVGTIQAGSETLGLAWAGRTPLRGLTTGISLRGFMTQLAGYGNWGAALGAGSQYQPGTWPCRFGLSIQNLGSQTAYIEQVDSLPLVVRAGLRWEAVKAGDLGVAVESDYFWHHDPFVPGQVRAGVEASLKHSLFLETGAGISESGADYSFGLGVEAGQFRVAYSFSPHPILGSYQRLSLDLLAQARSIR